MIGPCTNLKNLFFGPKILSQNRIMANPIKPIITAPKVILSVICAIAEKVFSPLGSLKASAPIGSWS